MQITASYQQWQLDWFFLHLVFGIYCSYLWTLKSGPLWLVAFYDGWVLETCWLCSIALWWHPFIMEKLIACEGKDTKWYLLQYCLQKKLLCSYGLRCQVVCSQVYQKHFFRAERQNCPASFINKAEGLQHFKLKQVKDRAQQRGNIPTENTALTEPTSILGNSHTGQRRRNKRKRRSGRARCWTSLDDTGFTCSAISRILSFFTPPLAPKGLKQPPPGSRTIGWPQLTLGSWA